MLREARKKNSLAKRARVLAVADDMKTKGEPITFPGLAKAARVSNWPRPTRNSPTSWPRPKPAETACEQTSTTLRTIRQRPALPSGI
ncbi:hypothetical protein ACIBLA_17310 [Streptomyces sp. NPDC050433]|uniref:hypothetical protein n=1 Tax=unclassified Streptomyces TaxID=2593676 RepID=UPI00344AA3F4